MLMPPQVAGALILVAAFIAAPLVGRWLRERERRIYGQVGYWSRTHWCQHGHPHASASTADACTGEEYWNAVTQFRR